LGVRKRIHIVSEYEQAPADSADCSQLVEIAAEIGFACLSHLDITTEEAIAIGKGQVLKMLEDRLCNHSARAVTAHIHHNDITINQSAQLDLDMLVRLLRGEPK
jgi:hypothetical protein